MIIPVTNDDYVHHNAQTVHHTVRLTIAIAIVHRKYLTLFFDSFLVVCNHLTASLELLVVLSRRLFPRQQYIRVMLQVLLFYSFQVIREDWELDWDTAIRIRNQRKSDV